MSKKKIRYAVVGLGHIAQSAMLPAFKNAQRNSELVALVSDDSKKLKFLAKKYNVQNCFKYADYDELLKSGLLDAVYISTPNTTHRQFADPAIESGLHVLCEKPLTNNVADCLELQRLVNKHAIKFMTGYRLHFDIGNLEAIKAIKHNKIGEPRIFNSIFTMQVNDRENIRLRKETGGGPLWDIGIYCINAARYLFKSEPIEVYATKMTGKDPRFTEVDEMFSAILKFPQARVASFICSFGASDISNYSLIGTKGSLLLEQAYDYSSTMNLYLTKSNRTTVKKFKKHDQFAAELLYFSDCILKDRIPEPGVKEGLIDVEIIESLLRSADLHRAITLRIDKKRERPSPEQVITRPGIREPEMVNVTNPSSHN